MPNRKAYVLIQTEIDQAESVVKALRGMPGVDSADLVIGPHDVIAVVQGADADAIAKMVVTGLQAVKGVHRTITYMVIAA